MGGANHRRLVLTEDQNPPRTPGRSSSLASERDPRSFSPTPRSDKQSVNITSVSLTRIRSRSRSRSGPDLSHELGLLLGAHRNVESAHGVEQVVHVHGLADASLLEELKDKQEVCEVRGHREPLGLFTVPNLFVQNM